MVHINLQTLAPSPTSRRIANGKTVLMQTLILAFSREGEKLEMEFGQLMFSDDISLVADSEEYIMVPLFDRVGVERRWRLYMSENNVMRHSRKVM